MRNNPPFTDFFKQNLTAAQYEDLPKTLGCTSYRITQLMNGSTNWQVDEIEKVAKLLNITPVDLIMKHGIGWNQFRLDEVQSLANKEGLEIGLLTHAA